MNELLFTHLGHVNVANVVFSTFGCIEYDGCLVVRQEDWRGVTKNQNGSKVLA